MASKYLQKYPVPENFQEILHDFTKEVLRAQSEDIIEFAYNYFDHKARGLEYKYQSRFNIDPSGKEQKQYNKTPYDNLAQQAQKVVSGSNKDNRSISHNSANNRSQQSATTHPEEKNLTQEFMGGLYGNAVKDVVEGRIQYSQQSQQAHSEQSQVSHREEKIIAQEFSSQVYDKAIEKHEVVVLDGPIEEYEKSALLIQKNFRSKKQN